MARMNASTNRFDPYRNFRFKVKWDNQYVAGLTKMGALKRTTEMVEFREAGENITSRKLPGNRLRVSGQDTGTPARAPARRPVARMESIARDGDRQRPARHS